MAMSPDAQEPATFERLQQLVAALRGDGGCPWDQRQTPISLKKYLLEECRELAEAIDSGQDEAIAEETGDVLFILALLISMFEEQHRFTSPEVLTRIIAKMVRRHPHVFAGTPVPDERELRLQWERIKAEDKSGHHP